jgi:ribonucleotide reductase beta subunit family protein with ferritin-like domain
MTTNTMSITQYLQTFADNWYGNSDKCPTHFKFLGDNEMMPIYNQLLSTPNEAIIDHNNDETIDQVWKYKHDPIMDPQAGTIKPVPIDSQELFTSYEHQRSLFWVDTAIDFGEDAVTFGALSKEKQYSIKGVLAFFAQADELVCECIEEGFLPDIQDPIIKLSYKFKAMMEDVHSLTYQTNLEMLIADPVERRELLNSIGDDTMFPSVKRKADWAKKWGSTQIPLAYRIFAQACTEGIQFSGSFMFIDFLEHAGIKLPGTQAANAFISRDEGFHTYDAGLIYKKLKYVIPPADAYRIVNECVNTEIQFMNDIIGDRFDGLTMTDISTHIKYTANTVVCNMLGYSEPFPGARCPFDFMKGRDLATVLNFFEVKTSSDYRQANLQLTESDFVPVKK